MKHRLSDSCRSIRKGLSPPRHLNLRFLLSRFQRGISSGWQDLFSARYFLISAYIRCYREFQTSLPVENAFARRWLETHNLKSQAVHTTVRSDLGTAYIWRVASSDSYAQENLTGKTKIPCVTCWNMNLYILEDLTQLPSFC